MSIGSVLKQVTKELPESFNMKAESVAPMLLKKGVKAEELKYADMDLPKTGKVTKQTLVEAEGKRQDNFYSVKMDEPNYQSINLAGGTDNPTYREKVLKFRRRDEVAADSRYTSSHFPEEENYLMHTRVYDETMDGTETRVVAEIQSDLHQEGRQEGYLDSSVNLGKLKQLNDDLDKEWIETDTIMNQARNLGIPEEAMEDAGTLQEFLEVTLESGVPTSPYEKTWLRKGIERELSDAVDEGREQLAIPIRGKV